VILATPGQRHEVTQLQALLDAGAVKGSQPDGRPGRGRPRKRPGKLVGDKGYCVGRVRRLVRRRGIAAVIPTKSTSAASLASTGPPIEAGTRSSATLVGSSSSAA
jgi:hypothetical protein